MSWQAILLDASTWGPLLLTARVMAVAGVLLLVAGVLIAYYLTCSRSRLRPVVDFLVTLPLVFPPIATGFALLLFFGRDGPVGRLTGAELVFSFPGVVLASFVAGLPLMVKPVEAALRGHGRKLAEAAYVLGKSEWQTFSQVLLPNVRRSVLAGWLLALGRCLGEVGMTLMLGGNVIGKTNTLSLEIYNAVFSGEFDRAIVLSCVIGVVSLALYAALRRLSAV
ncbi:molybdate ABC transporter permease subunit [Pseudodesulfovibrio senegalensis]|nr:ABC transporter permease subunit [Pseudodesulfovibrio senegalensis]